MNAAFALVLIMLAAGQLCTRLGALPEGAATVLNRFVIYVSLPALVLKHTAALRWEPSLVLLVLVPWVGLAVCAGVVVLAARTFGWSKPTRAALLLCVPLGNTSFLGFPMIAALVGADAVRYAVVYDQLGSFLAVSTYGLAVIARESGGETPTIRGMARKLATFPPFLALIAGVLPWHRPELLSAVVERVGDTLVPIAMFAVGSTLELRPRALQEPRALLFGLATKMLALPLLAFAMLRACGLRGVPMEVAVLEAAMPPMITAGALAGMAGLAPGLAAALVGYGVLLALVSLPVLASVLF
jgi:hypothetical protein